MVDWKKVIEVRDESLNKRILDYLNYNVGKDRYFKTIAKDLDVNERTLANRIKELENVRLVKIKKIDIPASPIQAKVPIWSLLDLPYNIAQLLRDFDAKIDDKEIDELAEFCYKNSEKMGEQFLKVKEDIIKKLIRVAFFGDKTPEEISSSKEVLYLFNKMIDWVKNSKLLQRFQKSGKKHL